MGGRFLSNAGTGTNCVLSMRVPKPSPVPDKNCAPMGPEILSSAGAGVCRKAPRAFPHSSSVLDKFCLQKQAKPTFSPMFGLLYQSLDMWTPSNACLSQPKAPEAKLLTEHPKGQEWG